MSKKIYLLDSSFLESLYPCRSGLLWFEEKFPDGVILTNNQQEMFELCERIIDNNEDNGDESDSYLVWLCESLIVDKKLFEDAYIGSYPVGISYDNTCSGTSYSTELSSYEPEHCALIICMFVDKFGEKASARNRLSSSK